MKRHNYSLLKCLFYSILLSSFLFAGKANAQTKPTSQDLIFSYGFANLAHNSSTYPTGFQGWKIANSSGTSFKTVAPIANTSLIANGSASSTAGGVYNYNGKVGMLASTSIDPAIVFCANTMGFTSITITFDVMTIRNPYDGTNNTRRNNVELQYRADTAMGTFTSLSGSIYRNNTTTQTGSGVTTPQNLQTITVTLPASCENLETVQIRIVQRDSTGSGARPSFAIDNICITGTSTISVSGSTTFCSGESVDLTAINGDSWLWSNGDTTQSISVSTSGSYNVTVTEGTNCNSSATSVNVTVNSFNYQAILFNESVGTVSQTTSISNHESNNGFDYDNLTMSGTADIRNTTPSSGYTGASGGANVFFALTHATNFKISGINTSYYENVNLEFGLYKSRTASDGTEFMVEVSTNDTNYTQVEFDALPTGTGTAIWHYVQINDNLPVSENLFIRFSSSDTATYFRLDDIKLKGDIESSYILASGLSTYCAGDTITLTASEGVEYLWSTSDTVQVINITENENYYVTVTDNNGCTGVANINISLPDSLAITDTIVNVTCFGQSNGSVDLTITGGTSPYTYLWSNDSTTQDLNNIPAGNYSVTVTDSHGCTAIDSMIVTEPEIPLIKMYGGFCGMVNVLLTDTLYSDTLSCASQYQFHIFNSNFNYTITSNTTALYLSQVAGLENNTVYGVTVRIIVGNDTASYGDTCYFRTKTIPPYGQSYSLYSTTTTDTLTGEETHDPMYVYDMYGNNYLLEDIVIPENSDIAGIFRLHFGDEMYDTDALTGTNDGFNDPTIGQQRKNVLIRVFEDISELITQNGVLPNPYPGEATANPCTDPEGTFPACRFIEINVQRSSFNDDGTDMTAAGTGSQFYGPELGEGIVFGNVWEYVNTGYDPYFNLSNVPFGTSQYYHGQVKINFDNLGYNWNLNLAQNANPANNEIDLYTVMLHEIIHMLGFGSLIDSDGSSKSFVGEGQYSIYDTYLQLSGNDMISSNGCYSTNFEVNPTNMNVACNGNMLFTGSNPSTVVYTSSPFSGGSSFSHFNCQNDSGYVMNPGISVGYTQRSPNEREVQALCALGYNVSGSFGTGVAWNGTAIPAVNYTNPCFVSRVVAGLNDFNEYSLTNATNLYNVEAGQSITINATGAANSILDNDINATKISCVEVILGGNNSNINLAGLPNSFVFTPPITFSGTAVIKYIPENDNGDKGNITYIYLDVTPPPLPACEQNSACGANLICYGNFEDIQNEHVSELTGFRIMGFNHPDLIINNNYIASNSTTSTYGCTTGQYPFPAEGNQYIGMVGFTGEAVCLPLSTPLIIGHNYRINFQVSTQNVATCPPSYRVYLSETLPCPETGGNWTSCGTFNPNLIWTYTSTQTNWIDVQQDFVADSPFIFLIIRGGQNSSYGYLDDVRLVDLDETEFTIESTVSNTVPCVGDTIYIQYTVCNNGVTPVDTVQLQYNIPYGITLIPDTNFDSNGIVSILPIDWTDSCIVMNLNLVVNNNAVAGSVIENTLMTLSGSCITGGAVTDTIIPGRADVLTISKTSNKPAYTAGDNVTYSVTICNTGNFDINNIVIQDTLPIDINFISSADFSNNADVLQSDSLNIPLGQCLTLHFIAQIDNSFTGDSITNCSAIILGDGVCDIPIEDCHTIYMCDTNFSVTLTPYDVGCLNGNNGSVSSSVSGGYAPYTYLWSNNAVTANILALEQGDYYLTVTDALGCTTNKNTTVNEPLDSLSAAITPSPSGGNCQSSATAFANGGTPDYSYSWSNTQNSATATGLCTNTWYYLTLTDVNGCIAIDSIIINNEVSCSVITSPSTCGDTSGTASAVVTGGTFPYSYLWSTNETTSDIDSLSYGTYYLTVIDNVNDTAVCSALVDNEASFTINITTTNQLCLGYNNGSAIVSITGGSGNYTYLWSNAQTNDTITGLAPGQYLVTITDTNGTPETSDDCIGVAQAIIGTSFTASISAAHVTCHDDCNGTATAIKPAAFTNVSYHWNTNDSIQSLDSLCPGTYAVTITNNDTTNCTATASVTLTNPAQFNLDLTYSYCFDDLTIAVASVTGGVPNYTYSWSTGSHNDTILLSYVIADSQNYHFEVTVTDAYGCALTDSFNLTPAYMGDLITIESIQNTSPAYCGNCNGHAGALVYTVENVNPLSFVWDDTISTGTTIHYDFFCAGQHILTIYDVNNCYVTQSFNVSASNPQPREVTFDATNPEYCSCNGAIEITGYTNMISPYQYNWTDGGSFTDTTATISSLCPSDYIVTVIDKRGCDVIDTVNIGYIDSLETSVTINTHATCNGYCDGNATVNATGVHTPFTYAWDNGETTATADSLCAGAHSVTVTDNSSCSVINYINITQPDAITFSLTSVDPICGYSNGRAEAINIQGGTGSYSFNWTGSLTANPITALAANTYYVTVSDANSCTTTSLVTLVCEEFGVDNSIPSSSPKEPTQCVYSLFDFLSNIQYSYSHNCWAANPSHQTYFWSEKTINDDSSYEGFEWWCNSTSAPCWGSGSTLRVSVDFHSDNNFHFIWNFYQNNSNPYSDYHYYGMCAPAEAGYGWSDNTAVYWACRNDVFLMHFNWLSNGNLVTIDGTQLFQNPRVVSCGPGYDAVNYANNLHTGSVLVDISIDGGNTWNAATVFENYSNGYILWKQDAQCFDCVTLGYTGSYSFVSYAWYEVNNPSVPVSTSSTFEPDADGNYYLVATDAYSNAITSDTVNIQLCSSAKSMMTGSETINKPSLFEFNIMPNPNKGEFMIGFNKEGSVEIQIYDMVGTLISVNYNAINRQIINMEDKPKGIYIIRANCGNEYSIKKVIIN